MTRAFSLRNIAVIVLLLPGLVTAAPIAGPCGLCGGGEACHMKQVVEQVAEKHSCCAGDPTEDSSKSALGSSSCDCGRAAPPATSAASPASAEMLATMASVQENTWQLSPPEFAYWHSSRPPAPPPAPPAYLIDCAFLT